MALDTTSLDKKKGKKRKDAVALSSATTESSATPSSTSTAEAMTVVKDEVKPAVTQPTSIFDDLDTDTTYTPTISTSTSSLPLSAPAVQPAVGKVDTSKNYFVNDSSCGDDVGDSGGNSLNDSGKVGGMSEEERMAPVLELLRAQQVREQRLQKGLQASGLGLTKMKVAEGVTHRDIFGGCDGGASMVNGESMSGKSSYDVYPESGDFETYDSDTEEPETKKVSVGAGTKGKRSGKDKVKDKAEKTTEGHGGTGEGGMNRAQRRALGRSSGEGDGDRKRPKHV